MWLETVVTVEPAAEPLTTDEAKAQCRAESITTDDALFDALVAAGRSYIEQYTSTKLITQTVEMRCGGFDDFTALPMAPLQSISGVAYLDPDGNGQTLDAAIYQPLLYGLVPSIRLKPLQSYPPILAVKDAITVTAIAGYGSSGANVPPPIIHALKLIISQWYDNREEFVFERATFAQLPNGVSGLLANFLR